MQEFVARENIRRFEARIADCTDPEQREILSRLLEQARVELADAEAEKSRQASRSMTTRGIS